MIVQKCTKVLFVPSETQWASTNVRALKQLHTTSVEVPLEMFISGRCMEYACERLHLLEMVVLNSLCL